METVFIVEHEYELWGRDEAKLIGVYATRADAEAAVDRARRQPGLRDWSEGFTIDEYRVGEDHWREGFSIAVPIHLPLLGESDGELRSVHAEWRPGDVYYICPVEGGIDDGRAAFRVGQVVRCEERTLDGVPGCLVAVCVVEGE